MKFRTSSATLTASVLLLGCSTMGNQEGAKSTAGSCIQANTKAETCEMKGGALFCPIYVFNTPSGTVVFPYKLKVPAGVKARLVWRLLEPKSQFIADDGPQELKNNSEFEDGSPSADDDGTISANGQRYKITYKNRLASTTHSYTIQFRNQGGTVFKCDPTITNEAD